MRLLLDTIHQSGAGNRAQLQDALEKRLANRDVEAEGPDSFASTVRVYRNEGAMPFPSELFSESWALTDGAEPDSLMAEELLGLEGFEVTPEDEEIPQGNQ